MIFQTVGLHKSSGADLLNLLYCCIEGFPCGRSAYHFSEKVLKVELWGLNKIPSADLLNLLYCCIALHYLFL